MNRQGKKYAVMSFESEISLSVGIYPNRWVNVSNEYFESGTEALLCLISKSDPFQMNEIIDGVDDYELQCKMGEMMINYQNPEWVTNNRLNKTN